MKLKRNKVFRAFTNGGGGGGLRNIMLSSNLLKSKNSYVRWWGRVGATNFQLLMLSPNLLKSKIPISGGGGGGGGWWNQLSTFDAESKFAKKKKKIFLHKNFLSFQTKIGMVLFWTLSTEWFPYTKYRRTTTKKP